MLISLTDLEKLRIREDMDAQLTTCLLNIIRFVNDKKDHIPPITTSDANPFPFQVRTYNALFYYFILHVLIFFRNRSLFLLRQILGVQC
jgi:hypothetical protein